MAEKVENLNYSQNRRPDNPWHNENVKKSGAFVFKDNRKLYEAMLLRRAGWSLNALAHLYDCDRTSLRYQVRRFCIFPLEGEVFVPERIVKRIIFEIKPKEIEWTIIDGERVSLGKSYQDYLKEAQFPPIKRN